jgi:hypothetical protein
MNIEHGKRITTESYYDSSLASTKQEIEVSLFSSKETILKDVIESLSVISSGETHKLDIIVQIDSQGRYRVIKKWIIQ